jgi:hypothetical protein
MCKILLKLRDVEVTQSKRGIISFSTNDKTAAMFDMAARIFELEEKLQFLLDNDSINDSSIDKEVANLLSRGHNTINE